MRYLSRTILIDKGLLNTNNICVYNLYLLIYSEQLLDLILIQFIISWAVVISSKFIFVSVILDIKGLTFNPIIF